MHRCLNVLILLSLFQFGSASVFADVVQEWQFNDTAGTTFGNSGSTFVNSGTVGDARFGGSGAASTDHTTDGSGSLVVTGVNTANRFVTTGSTMTSITSGKVQLSFRYNSFDFSEAAAEHVSLGATGNMHLFGNLGFGFTSGGNIVEQFRLQLIQNSSGGVNDPVVAFQHREVDVNDVDNLLVTSATSISAPFDVRVTVDLDNGGDMEVFVNDGSGEQQLLDLETGVNQVYGAASIDGLQIFNQQTSTNQGDQMLGDDSASIDFVRLEIIEAVPEPTSTVFLAAFAFAVATRRQKK